MPFQLTLTTTSNQEHIYTENLLTFLLFHLELSSLDIPE